MSSSAVCQLLAIRSRPRLPASSSLSTLLRTSPTVPLATPASRQTSLFSFSSFTSSSSPSPTPDVDGPVPPPPLPGRRVYTTKKVWPPDFSRLTPQEKLRFEKRFKRRVNLRAERPQWVKFIKLAQLFSITFVVIYCVLFMEWERGPTPFDGFRVWFWNTLRVLSGGPQQGLKRQGSSSSASSSTDRSAAATS